MNPSQHPQPHPGPPHRYMSWSFISINGLLLHVLGFERFSPVTALLTVLQLTSASGIMSIELCNRFFYIGKVGRGTGRGQNIIISIP